MGFLLIDHDYDGTDNLRFLAEDNTTPVSGGLVKLFDPTDYVNWLRGDDYVKARTTTGVDGRWVAPLTVLEGDYTIQFERPWSDTSPYYVASKAIHVTPLGVHPTIYAQPITLSGAQDGVNTTYTYTDDILTGSAQLYLNGGLLRVGTDNDYTIDYTTKTILLAGALAPSSQEALVLLGVR